MKKMLLLCLPLTFSLFAIIEYIHVIETPQSKSLNLLGVDHTPNHSVQELDTLIDRLKEEEAKGKIKILFESAEVMGVLWREGTYGWKEALKSLRPAALKAGLKTIPENIEIRKLARPWQNIFYKYSYPEDRDISVAIEKEIFETEDDPTVIFDPLACFDLSGKTAQEIRNAYKRCIGKSYEEVMLSIHSCNLAALTWQDVLNEFSEHEKNILDLWNSMTEGAQKKAFKREIELKQEKIRTSIIEIQKHLTPNDKLLDFALICEAQGRYKEICYKISRLGMDIFSAYFDLNLIHKALLTESDDTFKTFVINGSYHSLSLANFLTCRSKLGYRTVLCHEEMDHQGDSKTLDDTYFDCLNMPLWSLKYFPFSWVCSMISLRKSFLTKSLNLSKLFYLNSEPHINQTNENHHIINFLKTEFPEVSKKLEEHLPLRIDACNAMEPEDLIKLPENGTESDLKASHNVLISSLKQKVAANVISQNVFQKTTNWVQEAVDVLSVKIKLVSFASKSELEGKILNATLKVLNNKFKMTLFSLLKD